MHGQRQECLPEALIGRRRPSSAVVLGSVSPRVPSDDHEGVTFNPAPRRPPGYHIPIPLIIIGIVVLLGAAAIVLTPWWLAAREEREVERRCNAGLDGCGLESVAPSVSVPSQYERFGPAPWST